MSAFSPGSAAMLMRGGTCRVCESSLPFPIGFVTAWARPCQSKPVALNLGKLLSDDGLHFATLCCFPAISGGTRVSAPRFLFLTGVPLPAMVSSCNEPRFSATLMGHGRRLSEHASGQTLTTGLTTAGGALTAFRAPLLRTYGTIVLPAEDTSVVFHPACSVATYLLQSLILPILRSLASPWSRQEPTVPHWRHLPALVERPGFASTNGVWDSTALLWPPPCPAHPRHLSPPQFPAVAPLEGLHRRSHFAFGGTVGECTSVYLACEKGGLLGWGVGDGPAHEGLSLLAQWETGCFD